MFQTACSVQRFLYLLYQPLAIHLEGLQQECIIGTSLSKPHIDVNNSGSSKEGEELISCLKHLNKQKRGSQSRDRARSVNFCSLCTRVFDRNDKNSMKFDDFIQCCVMIKGLTESFQRLDVQRTGVVNINYETFLEMAIDTTIQ